MSNWIKQGSIVVNLDKVTSVHFDDEDWLISFDFDFDNSAEFSFETEEAYNNHVERLLCSEMGFSRESLKNYII